MSHLRCKIIKTWGESLFGAHLDWGSSGGWIKRILKNWIDFCAIHQDEDFRGKNTWGVVGYDEFNFRPDEFDGRTGQPHWDVYGSCSIDRLRAQKNWDERSSRRLTGHPERMYNMRRSKNQGWEDQHLHAGLRINSPAGVHYRRLLLSHCGGQGQSQPPNCRETQPSSLRIKRKTR